MAMIIFGLCAAGKVCMSVCVGRMFVFICKHCEDGGLCVKTKFKRLVFHSPELVKTLCVGV